MMSYLEQYRDVCLMSSFHQIEYEWRIVKTGDRLEKHNFKNENFVKHLDTKSLRVTPYQSLCVFSNYRFSQVL